MKKLLLLLILSMVSMLAFAQSGAIYSPAGGPLGRVNPPPIDRAAPYDSVGSAPGRLTDQALEAQTEQPLVNPVTQTIKGMLNAPSVLQDGDLQIAVQESCRFSLALPADQKAIEARRISEITFNPQDNTCDALFEVGAPATGPLPSSGESANLANTSSVSSSGVPIRTDDPNAGAAGEDESPGQPLTTTESAGYLKTWWVDPLGLVVNSVKDSTTWKWKSMGHCVTGILGGYNLTWLSGSGWGLLSNSWNNSYNCTQTTSASTVLFDNPVFCFGITTYAYYNPNKVNGRQNGDLVGTWNDSVYGSACVYLLSFRMQLQRTMN